MLNEHSRIQGEVYVVIPDADSELTLKVIRCLGKIPNIFPILITTKSSNPALFSKFCWKHYLVSSYDETSLLHFFTYKIAPKKPIIFPVDHNGFMFVSKHKPTLLKRFYIPPIPDVNTLENASDKFKLSEIANSINISTLPSFLLSNKLPHYENSSKFNFPFLIKARNRRGGFGISIIKDVIDLQKFLDNLNNHQRDQYLIQPYIDGTDYSLSVFCQDGQILSYTLWRAVCYGDKPFSIPTVIQFVNEPRILTAGKRMIKALNWNGVADIDFFVEKNSDSFWLLEMNTRFWQTVGACREAGVNFPVLQSLSALGTSNLQQKAKVGLYYARPSGVLDMLKNRLKKDSKLTEGSTTKSALWEIFTDPGPEIRQAFQMLK